MRKFFASRRQLFQFYEMASRKLDINKATVDQFEQLAGIGRTKAEAIVNYRRKLGKFSEISDLQKVTGIGQGIMNQLRPVLKCCKLKVLSRSAVKKQAQRITRSVASALLSVQQEHTDPSAANTCHLSPLSRRYCTRSNSKSNGFEKRKLTWQKRLTARSKRRSMRLRNAANVASEPAEIAPGRQISAVKNLSVAVAEAVPCTSRMEDNSMGSINTESSTTSDNNAFGGSTSAARTSQNMPGCSKSQDVFPNAQGFEGRGFTNRSVPSSSTQNCDTLADQCSRLVGFKSGEGHDLLGSEESVHGSSSQLISGPVHDGSGISTQCRAPVTCDGSEKPSVKRKAEAGEDDRMSKKLCVEEDGAIQLPEDLNGELPNVSASEIQQMSPRKQKIPSKKNPPLLLDGWLKTFQNWSHAERLLALDELMETCDPTEVRHVMQVIEPQFQRDFISLLPKELALYVLSFLEPNDLLRAAQTCRYWHMLAEDNILWREKCHEEGISESLVFGNFARRKRTASKSPWKSLYLRQQQIEQNWRTSNRPPKVLKGHDDHVITCLEFNGTKIVSGSDDNTLKVWSAVTGKCLRTLTGHTGGVWSSQMLGNTIVSGSTDRTLKVWDADTGRTIYTLYGHTSTVRCMHLYNNRVVSGSRDATLRMWDIDTGHCLHVLIGHMAAVRCVQYDGRRVVSGAYDYMVKIWDPEKETCLQTLAGHTNRVYSLQFDGVHIVSGSLDTSIRVWSAETGACLHTLVGHQSLTSGMELKDNILVSGNADSTVKVWNITTGQCLQTLNGPNKHQSAVTCLQFNRKLIITSSDDGTIKIWDLKTGEFIRNLVTLESGGSGGVVWRIRCNNSKLVCAVGSRNGTEETKLLVLDFDVEEDNSNAKCALPAS